MDIYKFAIMTISLDILINIHIATTMMKIPEFDWKHEKLSIIVHTFITVISFVAWFYVFVYSDWIYIWLHNLSEKTMKI